MIRRFLMLSIILSMIFPAGLVKADDMSVYGENLSVGKPSYGVQSWNNISPSKANDGNDSTAWYNKYVGKRELNWYVDFEKICVVNYITAKVMARDSTAALTNFSVLLSANEDFTDAVTVYNNISSEGISGYFNVDLSQGAVTVTDEGVEYTPFKQTGYRYMKIKKNEINDLNNMRIFELTAYGEECRYNLSFYRSEGDESELTEIPEDGEMVVEVNLYGEAGNFMLMQYQYSDEDSILSTKTYKKTIADKRAISVSEVTSNTRFALYDVVEGVYVIEEISMADAI